MNEEDNVENYYLDALYTLINKQTFNYFDIATMGYPEILNTVHFNKIIWFTGSNLNPVLSDTTLNLLTSYLDQGGKLFMSGQNIITVNQSDSLFTEYIKTRHVLIRGNFQVKFKFTYNFTSFFIINLCEIA